MFSHFGPIFESGLTPAFCLMLSDGGELILEQ